MDINDNVISKAALWADRIHAFQKSGLSRKDWCQQNEISQSTLLASGDFRHSESD